MDKTMRTTIRTLPLALAGLLLAMCVQPAGAQTLREANDSFSARALDRAELRVNPDTALLSEAASFVASDTDMAWQAFAAGQSAPWIAYVDKRTGKIDYAEGGNVAWIPGAGDARRSPSRPSRPSPVSSSRKSAACWASMPPISSTPAAPASPPATSGSSILTSSPAAARSRERASSSTSTTAT